MNIYRYIAVAVLLAVLTAMPSGAAAENVTVDGEYLTNSDGYNYGMNFFLSSTVNERICVYPRVVTRVNVNGSVTPGPVMLSANASRFSIGSFISADQSQPWSVDVAARWTSC